MKKKAIIILIGIFTFSFLFYLSSNIYLWINRSMEERIQDYCKSNNEMTFADITNFDWNIAYVDHQYYSSGENIKEKYGLPVNLKLIHSDSCYRIAFFKDNILINDSIINFENVLVDISAETIRPDTQFSVTWEKWLDESGERVRLSPKN